MDINSHQIHLFFNPENEDYLVTNTLSEGLLKIQSFPDLELVIEDLFIW